jgi:hypothetical protein
MNVRRFVTLALLLMTCPAHVRGDELCYVPSLALGESYNSNIMLTTYADYVRPDYIATLSPGFEITDRTERFDSSLSLRFDGHHYARNEELNATDQQYSGSVRYAATPLFRVSADAGYQKISNPSLDAGPAAPRLPVGTVIPVISVPPQPATPSQPSGNSNTANTGGGDATSPPLPLVATPVERISSSISMGNQLTETTSLTALYRFGWSSYAIPRYRDRSHDVQAGLAIDLGRYLPRVQGRLNTGYSQYLLPNSRTINVSGTIGLSHDVSETLSILVDGGIRHTSSESFVEELVPNQTPPTAYINTRIRIDHTDWAGVGHLALNYKGHDSGAELMYTRDFSMAYLASGHQAPAEREALSLTVRHKITQELSAFLTTEYSTYTAARVLTQTNISVSPLIRYELFRMNGERDLALEAAYERTRIDYAVSGTADRYMYVIRLSARFPYCSSSQYK